MSVDSQMSLQPSSPVEVQDSLRRFHADFPDPRRVAFLMMQFGRTKAHDAIVAAVKEAFRDQGVIAVRADDRAYHDDLFLNVLTYLHGCGLGVAVFERIENDVFNPNVSLEVGYLMALDKPVCYLKDQTLRSLPTDIIGRLYIDFDPQEPELSLQPSIGKWLRDRGLCANCDRCSITIRLNVYGWDRSYLDDIVEGFRLMAPIQTPKLLRIREGEEAGTTVLDFEADGAFIDDLLKKRDSGYFEQVGAFEVVEIAAESSGEATPRINFLIESLSSDEDGFSVQLCRLASFKGLQEEAEFARKLLPPVTGDADKCVIYVTQVPEGWYFHSNFINAGCLHPTKAIAREVNGLAQVLPWIVRGEHRRLHDDDELLLQHIKKVRYIFDKSTLIAGRPPLALDGATRVEVVEA